MTPMDIPLWLVERQRNKLDHVYRLSMEEAVKQVMQAIGDQGGYVRYGTIQGKDRTLYARDWRDETIMVYLTTSQRDPSLIKISIVCGFHGSPNEQVRYFRAIRSTPVE